MIAAGGSFHHFRASNEEGMAFAEGFQAEGGPQWTIRQGLNAYRGRRGPESQGCTIERAVRNSSSETKVLSWMPGDVFQCERSKTYPTVKGFS